MDMMGIIQSILSPEMMKDLIKMIQPFMTPEMMEAMGEWLNIPGGLLETVLKMMGAK
jgi:hypothetical protein